MTDEQIIKALECCVNEKADCKGCPYESDGCLIENGKNKLLEDTLGLINRLKAENQKLENIEWLADKTIATLIAENEKWQNKISELQHGILNCKSEAIREFWERLKLKKAAVDSWVVYVESGDNLVKEMVGDAK